ncbi:hypothetical protein BDF19DRAFT_411060 [Syncephalis fuscata]|nr:hypothetical protein BDF19DRAFT_411060 [Syncephalis fuscata]
MSTTAVKHLFKPLNVGAWPLNHRIALAPLTRCRAINNVHTSLAGEYYAQRATPGGLLITEATGVSDTGVGSFSVPGIWTTKQRDAWKEIVKSVKEKSPETIFVMQLWHRGRDCHSDFMPNNQPPVAPSPIAISGATTMNKTWKSVPYEVPRALGKNEIATIVEDYRRASINAKEAGFDGVELHGANGYLINQFLESRTNQRTDEYGGSIRNRIRFCSQVVKAAIDVFGSDRVGIRFSPYGNSNDMHDNNPIALYSEAVQTVTQLGVAYVHIIEPRIGYAEGSEAIKPIPSIEPIINEIQKGGSAVIRSGGYTGDSANEAVEANRADIVSFGRLFIANPDLPARFLNSWALNPYNRDTFYTPGSKGYTDYPFFSSSN